MDLDSDIFSKGVEVVFVQRLSSLAIVGLIRYLLGGGKFGSYFVFHLFLFFFQCNCL